MNPHAGKDGYAPVQGGIVAALPYLDDLLAGHSLATLERAARGGASMRDVWIKLEGWWEKGETAALATVVGTYSSAPRQPGASMLVGPAGEAVGSVSGGCVEGAVYELGEQVLADGRPVLQRYGVSDDDAFAVGLTCGGIIDIFVEKVDPETYAQLGEVAEAVRAELAGRGRHGRRRARRSGWASGWSSGRTAPTAAPAPPASTTPSATTPAACSTPAATRCSPTAWTASAAARACRCSSSRSPRRPA